MKRIVLLSAVFASFAFAEVKMSPSYDKCMDKQGGSTSSMLECASKEVKVQDTKLNKAYKDAMKVLDPKKQAELKNVQRLWLSFRKAKCDFYDGITGGTMDSLNVSSCFLDMTADRAEEIKGFAESI
jgi:uncharacterized protein YecT (DUF1311 family)